MSMGAMDDTIKPTTDADCHIIIASVEHSANGYNICVVSGQPESFVEWTVVQGTGMGGSQNSNSPEECFSFPDGSYNFYILQRLENDSCFLAFSVDTFSLCPEKIFEVGKSCNSVRLNFLEDSMSTVNPYFVDWGDGSYSMGSSDTISHNYTECPTSEVCVTFSKYDSEPLYYTCCYAFEEQPTQCFCDDFAVGYLDHNCLEVNTYISIPEAYEGQSIQLWTELEDTIEIYGDTILWLSFEDYGTKDVCIKLPDWPASCECCSTVGLPPPESCNTAVFELRRNELSSSCMNPCYTIIPECTLEDENTHVWVMEDSVIYYGQTPPECYLFSNFLNDDGEVCVRHYILVCDSIIADTTICVAHPNGSWVGRPGEQTQLSDLMLDTTWGLTVHEFLLNTQGGPHYPKIDGTLVLDEPSSYASGRWYFGENARVLNNGQYFGLDSMRFHSAWRLDVSRYPDCCFWLGVESYGDTHMDWDSSILSDAHYLLHYPAKTSFTPPRIDLTRNLMHTNIFGIKSVGQNLNFSSFHENEIIGENTSYSRNIPCGCSAINGMDFREMSPLELLELPHTGESNTIQDYEHGIHVENVRLKVRNIHLRDLVEMGVPKAPSAADINSSTDKRGIGIYYKWTLGYDSELDLDHMDFRDMEYGVQQILLGSGRHILKAKATERRSSIYYNNVGTAYRIASYLGVLDGLIQGNDINVDHTGVHLHVLGENNNIMQVTDNNIISDGIEGVAHGVFLFSSTPQLESFRVRLNDIETAGSSEGHGIGIFNCYNSIVEHNRIHPSGSNIKGIHLVRGGNSVIQCNDIEDVETGIHIVESQSNEYSGNELDQNKHDFYAVGDLMGSGGSVLRWNSMNQSGDESVYYEADVITGVQHHSAYNSWTNQTQNEVEAIHHGSLIFGFNSQFYAPIGSSPGSVFYPNRNPEILIEPYGGQFTTPSVDFCLLSTEPDSPIITTPQFLGFATDSVYTEVITDTASMDSLKAAQRMDFELGLYELIMKNPDWLVGNSTLTGYYDSLTALYVGQRVILIDSISGYVEGLEWQRMHLDTLSLRLDTLSELISAQYDSLSNCVMQTCRDSIGSILSVYHLEADSLRAFIDSISQDYQAANNIVLDSLISWNGSITDTALYQWSEKRLTDVSLRMMQGDSLTAQDKLDLQTIASYCDEDAGRAVWQARILCWSLYAELYLESQCVQALTALSKPEDETLEYHLILYPNPGESHFRVLWSGDESAATIRMEVYDIAGRLIHELRDMKSGMEVQTRGWSNGLYLVRVYIGDEVYQTKWLKIN